MTELPFKFEVPVDFFEKADAPAGQQRRIGGIITTESPDRQGEIVLQRGLDFSGFITNGWFNDNHTKDTDGVVGYPESVKFFKRGTSLPNGVIAKADGHWAEGYMLEGHERADRLWSLGKALAKTNRRLGYSVEGSIQQRLGPLRKTVAKARVKNVAITNCPVNTDTGLEVLAKGLVVAEAVDLDPLLKTLGMGPVAIGAGGAPVPPASMGPQTGMGAGRVLAEQDLETDKDEKKRLIFAGLEEPKKIKKSLTDAEAMAWVQTRYPDLTLGMVGRIVDLTKALHRQGRI